MSENSRLGGGTSPKGHRQALQACTYTVCVSGSYEPPGQLVPPAAVPTVSVASGPSILLRAGGVKIGPILNLETTCAAWARRSGVKSINSSLEMPLRL